MEFQVMPKFIVRPEDSPMIDAYMGDIVRDIARQIGNVLIASRKSHGLKEDDLAILASGAVHAFAEDFGTDGIEALLRTRTLSRFSTLNEAVLRNEKD